MTALEVEPHNDTQRANVVRPQLISRGTALRQRWKHNVVSWLPLPLRTFGSRAMANSFGILMYHRVCPIPAGHIPPTYNVSPKTFGRQLSWLLDNGYRAWPLSRLIAARQAQEKVPAKTFAITFDDGYQNNFTHAFPILAELRVPATIFLATAYLDSDRPFPFDNWIDHPDQGLPGDSWRPLSRQQCHQMQDSGWVEFGCHTHTHADFRQAPHALEQDLIRCRDILHNEFGIDRPAFAYPYGCPDQGFTNENLAMVARKVGCSCALEVSNSLVTPTDDMYHWSRFDVAPADSGPTIAAKLEGWSQWLRGWWRRSWKGAQ